MPCPNCGVNVNVGHYYTNNLCRHCEIDQQEMMEDTANAVCECIESGAGYVHWDLRDGVIDFDDETYFNEKMRIRAQKQFEKDGWKVRNSGHNDISSVYDAIWKASEYMAYEYIVIFDQEKGYWVLMERVRA